MRHTEKSPDAVNTGASPLTEPPREQVTPTTEEQADTIIELPVVAVNYDIAELNAFFDVVFHAANEGEIFAHASPGAPKGMGSTLRVALGKLALTRQGMPCYYSTSTLDRDNGELRHTRRAFKQFCVVVLDDIGTKIPLENIPESMTETYNIESSRGNHQLGYVLKEPITNYDEAQALIQLLVEAGLTDGGGAMPCKKVRMPCGVNGKEGEKGRWQVKLHFMDGPLWTPQELLDAAGVSVDWEVYCKQLHSPAGRTKRIGTTAWSPVPIADYDHLTGQFDPVLEWLYANNYVLSDFDGEWVTIKCPWAKDHTSGDGTAGYAPLGRGVHPHTRGFKCFHDHCKGHHTTVFLALLMGLGAPEAAPMDASGSLSSKYVYDAGVEKVWDITNVGEVRPYSINAINNTTQPIILTGKRGGTKSVNPLNIMLRQPTCVKVMGATFDASNPSSVIRDVNGNLWVNTFRPMSHPPVRVDMAHVQPFIDHIEFLIPAELDRGYFLDWLACKAQDPAFRGCAIIMVAQSEGIGRGALVDILSKLFGQHNMQRMEMNDLLSSSWTNFQEKLIVHVDEVSAIENWHQKRTAYNRLKGLIDPRNATVTVNPKYAPQRTIVSSSSYLLFTNNEDGVMFDDGTRRFFVIQNAAEPKPAEYYARLHAWSGPVNSRPAWAAHVWQWLLNRKVDISTMMTSPPVTTIMKDMIASNSSAIDRACEVMVNLWPHNTIPVGVLLDQLDSLGLELPQGYRAIGERIMRRITRSLRGDEPRRGRIMVGSRPYTLRLKKHAEVVVAPYNEAYYEMGAYAIESFSPMEFRAKVVSALSELDL